jgi:hypothetical protein
MAITLLSNVRLLRRVLGVTIAVLAGCYLATQIGMFAFGHDEQLGLVRAFDLNGEGNVPTWYATTMLFLAALMLAYIAAEKQKTRDRFAPNWWFLAAVFVFLSLDEAAGIHDMVDKMLHDHFHPGGVLYYAWVVPWSCAALVVLITSARFLANLPRTTRRAFIIAGVIYVGGAVGIELFEAMLDDVNGSRVVVAGLVFVEEMMEMAGVAAFVSALAAYIVNYIADHSVMTVAEDRDDVADRTPVMASSR